MANQLALLSQGIKVWNTWRAKNPNVEVDLREADLSYTDLRFVNLSSANLCGVNFSYANLRSANLSFANLGSANLNFTILNNTDLSYADFQNAHLIDAKLGFANLRSADLSKADLRNADLSFSDLSFASLVDANIYGINALSTDFTKSSLTGACIADWQIGSSTILKDVECDYIFRTYNFDTEQFSGRLPVDPESTFAPGEFTQRFQIIASALEAIDITFTQGIDWQAFFQSFQDLRTSRPNEDISIQGMERKGDALIVRLEVEAEADKAAIETEVKQRYAHQLAALEAQYQERLRLQSDEIATYRQTQSSLLHIVQTMAEKDSISQNFHGPVGNVAATNQGKMQAVQHNYFPEQQDLSEAAKEIQALLTTLAETYNTTTDAEKEQLMKEFDKEVEKHPKWRRALKAGGIELIKVLCAPIGVPLEMARVYLEDED